MAFAVVLDASVLYPLPLRDTLLRAETELYDPYWSEHILEEVVRNLVADGRASEEQARTLDLKDFPIEACEPFTIEPLHPDVFLLDLYGLDRHEVYEAVERQAAALPRPPMSLDELLDRLGVTVPDFAQTLREHA